MTTDVKFTPLHDVVLIKRDQQNNTSAGGIVLTGAAAEKPNQGTVLAVGKGKHCEHTGVFVETTVEVGDTVIFPQQSGYPIRLKEFEDDPEAEIIVMREVEVIGIIS